MAVSILKERGHSVAVVTNDQGDQLVDSGYLGHAGVLAGEVTGGCFCCRYHEFTAILQSMPQKPDVVFAEAVGSCADLVATVVKPLLLEKEKWKVTYSVLADASFLCALLREECAFVKEEVRYIYQKQLEDAALLVLNKSDLLGGEEQIWLTKQLHSIYPGKTLLFQNSLDHSSVIQWLDVLEKADFSSTLPSLVIDYEKYGTGEAMMAWLDEVLVIESINSSAAGATSWLMERFYRSILDEQLMIGHLKFLLKAGGQEHKISYTHFGTNSDRSFSRIQTNQVNLLVNARIQGAASRLTEIMTRVKQECMERFGCRIMSHSANSFQPGLPKPVHRMQ